MSNEKDPKDLEKEISEEDYSGKKFEDLSEEEMDVIQGSGGDDVEGEGIEDTIKLTLSLSPFVCR